LLVLLGRYRTAAWLAGAAAIVPCGWGFMLRMRSKAEALERRRRRLDALSRVRSWLSEAMSPAVASAALALPLSPERAVRFGLSLFTSGARDRLLLAITSNGRAFFARARLVPDERVPRGMLLGDAQIYMLADDEAAFDAVGPDGKPFDLDVADLSWLLHELATAQPEATGRILLSGPGGAGVELDGTDLSVGRKIFDLRAPLEWKPLLFQEGLGGSAVARAAGDDAKDDIMAGGVIVYQATSIRQLGTEAVIVATLPSLPLGRPALFPIAGHEHPEIERALRRDLRLMQASADDPPARELRTAVERVFMLPLRAALDRAPRASRSDVSSPAAAAPTT
jgi:hypothetical protein